MRGGSSAIRTKASTMINSLTKGIFPFRSRSLKMYTKYIRSVNWDTIKFDIADEKMKTIPLLNPLKGTKNMVEALFEKGLSVKDFIEELEG